jgi:hypothetical protein
MYVISGYDLDLCRDYPSLRPSLQKYAFFLPSLAHQGILPWNLRITWLEQE